tara:strand:- start:255 stop:551 length:297 start_codon:yes stop_codon:yes gene_type:complete
MKPRENTATPTQTFSPSLDFKSFPVNSKILDPKLLTKHFAAMHAANILTDGDEAEVDEAAVEAEAAEKKKKTRNIVIGSVIGVLLLGGGIALVVKSKK